MIGVPTWILIALSCLSLIGFGFSGVLVSQANARSRHRNRRVEAVVAPYRKTRGTLTLAFRAATVTDRSLAEHVASIFAFNPRLGDQYPVKWWIVLGVTLVLARVVAGFVVDIVGNAGLISVPIVWIGACRYVFNTITRRRRQALIRQFPDALSMIVRSVRVGVSVPGAIHGVARDAPLPTSSEFIRLESQIAVGVPLDEAVLEMASRNELAEYRFFAIAIGLQAKTGGGLSETLENLGDLSRKRLALGERGHALASEARTSSLILGCLPIVMGSGLTLFNPPYMAPLFSTSSGKAILASAILLLAMGALVMRLIIKKSLS
jgi:tight adherence protein B